MKLLKACKSIDADLMLNINLNITKYKLSSTIILYLDWQALAFMVLIFEIIALI
jgi:hypothetical protein